MTFADDSRGMIGELELLQNDLLERLDDLNQRVETVIKEWTGERKAKQDNNLDASDSDTEATDAKAA